MTEVGTQLNTAVPSITPSAEPAAPVFRPAPPRSTKSNLLSISVLAVVVPGIFATVALPAYAYTPPESTEAAEATAEISHLRENEAQSLAVAADAAISTAARDAFSATSEAELERARLAAIYAAYSGPSAADYLANPPYPSFSLDQVVQVALSYQGVPYRYGGSNPAGFDCSGFTQFVYAQFGISLPHSASAQGAMGTAISPADALPGDIVVLDGGGHVGIYLGGNQMIDAPYEGRVVEVRSIYSSAHYFVRFGI